MAKAIGLNEVPSLAGSITVDSPSRLCAAGFDHLDEKPQHEDRMIDQATEHCDERGRCHEVSSPLE
jgi:hypothetical protein